MFHEREKRNERVRVRVTGKMIMNISELEMIKSPKEARGKASHSQGSIPVSPFSPSANSPMAMQWENSWRVLPAWKTQGASPEGIPGHPRNSAASMQQLTAFSEANQMAPTSALIHADMRTYIRSARVKGSSCGPVKALSIGLVAKMAAFKVLRNFLSFCMGLSTTSCRRFSSTRAARSWMDSFWQRFQTMSVAKASARCSAMCARAAGSSSARRRR
mmetsp:Transcript_38497/g.121903  ORF Transcript_38497/g.121903 Transcript_38497/m.121903 type:complete len:217 (+) Transcript_38497:1512-2162(+)